MGIEIERRFLVKNDDWKNNIVKTSRIVQSYISTDPERVVRLRMKIQLGGNYHPYGYLTIKGKKNSGSGLEFEYKIPYDEVDTMMSKLSVGTIITKDRFHVEHNGLIWEVDVFKDYNSGLVIAEIELNSIYQDVTIPDWCGEEITDDPRYSNLNLALKPYKTW